MEVRSDHTLRFTSAKNTYIQNIRKLNTNRIRWTIVNNVHTGSDVSYIERILVTNYFHAHNWCEENRKKLRCKEQR